MKIGKACRKNLKRYGIISIFRLQIYIFRLKIRIFILQICIFRLKIEISSDVVNFSLGVRNFFSRLSPFSLILKKSHAIPNIRNSGSVSFQNHP